MMRPEASLPCKCSVCGAAHSKLWRPVDPGVPEAILCTAHLQLPEGVTLDAFGESSGRRKRHAPGVTDARGNVWVPAIPIEGRTHAYWGWFSVPPLLLLKWRKLPTYPEAVH